ncbi:helicase C-terminal domain-containing protein [Paenibacillus aceti]|uniref:ATP-dependent helicase C-terminal domain-containing protein n=1 Tax=Paenibacillus aceti TaxID=1820010 RepID=A0ABQ1W8K3_9BACL|nr:helicase C-terminal domain-containing protein [Paenibacillus aceti]GGG18132.1 hypothetical protein GCM10010913_45340 [Paenibacillus aceti]
MDQRPNFPYKEHVNHYGREILNTFDIQATYERIICDQMDVTLFRQEQGGVEKLTQQFKNDETSVLLGSGSFFSGFSVPGSSLVSVIFSRLPFPVPYDPYFKLIGEGLEDVFMQEVLFPNMMVKLNQGVGRLIRDIKDYGIITILDPSVFPRIMAA